MKEIGTLAPRQKERTSESASSANNSGQVDWAIIAIWGFALFSFAALLFCIWIMFAKCRGALPH